VSAHYYKIGSYCTVYLAMCSTSIKKSVRTVLYVSLYVAHYYKISSYSTVFVAMCSTLLQNHFVLYFTCRYVKHIITKSVRNLQYVSLREAH
jgi:hypothetical protein